MRPLPFAMRRAEKAQRIERMLAEMYPDPPVPLDHASNSLWRC